MDNETSKAPSIRILVISILVVIVFWAANFWIAARYTYEARGTFGDTFGVVNALFTGLAFAGVIYGLFVQRHEVKLLTEELQGTKRLAEEQQKLAEIQISAQQKQQFEATFFSLLRVFNDLVTGIDLRKGSNSKEVIARGRDAFTSFVREFEHSRNFKLALMYERSMPRSFSVLEDYEDFYKKHKSDLGHYFRTLYNLFKYLDGSNVEDKRVYANLIRAQLSDDEVYILF